MESLTIVTEDGRRHIRTIDRMGAGDIDNPRQPSLDGGTNPLMWHTAFQVADYNRNPRTISKTITLHHPIGGETRKRMENRSKSR